MRHLPIFWSVRGSACLVVGGGAVAQRKVHMLVRAGAAVTVIAPRATQVLHAWRRGGRIALFSRPFDTADVDGHVLVFAATGVSEVDAAVSRAARGAAVPVCAVDRPALSDFIMPSIVDRSPVIVAVSTGGAAPVLARQIRAAIEALLPADLGRLAEAAERMRNAVRARMPSLSERRRFWDGFFRNWRAGRLLARHAADEAVLDAAVSERAMTPGHVTIAGAGPGDPDLLTLKALQRLQDADVIVHDRLVEPRVLDYARRDAERIYVGKAPGRHSCDQAEICALLARYAGEGKRVVRLKGGDPFIFGRGGEELAHLRERGIDVEIVPGITAAAGCAAEAGIPLTDRGVSQSVTYLTGASGLTGTSGLTGASGGDVPDYDWEALARISGTLVFYMAVGTAEAISDRLIAGGISASTPVAVIENGTQETQRTLAGPIGRLGALIRDNDVRSPALLVIGEVVDRAAIEEIAPCVASPLAAAS